MAGRSEAENEHSAQNFLRLTILKPWPANLTIFIYQPILIGDRFLGFATQK